MLICIFSFIAVYSSLDVSSLFLSHLFSFFSSVPFFFFIFFSCIFFPKDVSVPSTIVRCIAEIFFDPLTENYLLSFNEVSGVCIDVYTMLISLHICISTISGFSSSHPAPLPSYLPYFLFFSFLRMLTHSSPLNLLSLFILLISISDKSHPLRRIYATCRYKTTVQ